MSRPLRARLRRLIGSRATAQEPAAPATDVRIGQTVLDDEALGAVAVDLAWRWPAWVNRRVETVSYLEATTIRRSVSIDFTLPPLSDLAAPVQSGDLVYVPLQLLEKQPLMHLDVTDEQGASVSVLNTHRNADLASRGLIRFVRSLYAPDGARPLPPDLVEELTPLAGEPACAARARLSRLYKRGSLLSQLFNLNHESAGPERPEAQLIRDLSEGFLQLVQVRYQPGQHRVIKVAYDRPTPWGQDGLRGFERALIALCALPVRHTFEDAGIGLGRSHHFEIVAPDETEIITARLDAQQWDATLNREVPAVVPAQLSSRSRAHIYTGLATRVSPGSEAVGGLSRNDRGAITVAILPQPSGVLLASTVVSALSAATLLAFAARITELDGQTAAAVLLLLPAIVGVYLSRPGEHSFSTRMLSGVRRLAAGVSAMALVLAVLVAGGWTKPESAPRLETSIFVSQAPPTCGGDPAALQPTPSRVLVVVRCSPQPADAVRPGILIVAWVLGVASAVTAAILVLSTLAARAVRRSREA